MDKLGIGRVGMTTEQFLENETADQRAERMQLVGTGIGKLATAMMPAPISMALSLARAYQSGDIGGAIGSLIGSKSGLPYGIGSGVGQALGRSFQTGAPVNLENIARVVGSNVGSGVMGKLGYEAGGNVGGMIGSNVGGSVGGDFASWVAGGLNPPTSSQNSEKSSTADGKANSGGTGGNANSIMLGGRR
jgi:hypothetical protein